MLSLSPLRLAHALALFLLCLTPLAQAQSPTAKPAVPQVLLRVEYTMVNVDEANRLVAVRPSHLPEDQCLAGKSADQIYHSLIRSQGSLSQCPPATAFSTGEARFQINTSPFGDLAALLPSPSFTVPLEADLFVTPQLNRNSSITVTLNTSAGIKDRAAVSWSCLPVARTIHSGEKLLLISPSIQTPDASMNHKAEYKAFMFVTPTVLKSKTAANTSTNR